MAITIQRGDTLSGIAKKYNTTVQKLASTNNIRDINRIYAGATIMLPGEVPATDHPLGSPQPQQPAPVAPAPGACWEDWSARPDLRGR